MPQIDNIEQHSEEVQDIMGRIPGRLTRWGLTVIFLVFFMIVVGSYFFTFNEIVSAPMAITTTDPPAPLISKASGRIARWYVTDGQHVKKGDPVAIIENSTARDDLFILENIISRLDSSNVRDNLEDLVLPEKLVLGELQSQYNQFYSNLENYKDYMANHFLSLKIDLLHQEMARQKEYYGLSLEQKTMMEEETKLSEKGLERRQVMVDKGGVSEADMDNATSAVIQQRRSYSALLASIKSTEITLLNQQSSLLAMEEEDRANIARYELSIAEDLRSLKNAIKSWKDTYLLTTPVDGTVTLTRFWSVNHVVSSGERLATIVPVNQSGVICRANVPSLSIGKVEPGQKVNLKLSGFPYMEHGILIGKVSSVSLVPEEAGYVVEITVVENMQSSYRKQLRLVQEMEGTADIITRKTRLIIRFITPLKVLFGEK